MGTNMVLREERGGLDKKQVLAAVEEMLMLKMSVESGAMTREQALAQAQWIANKPERTSRKGFREDDVQAYFRTLMETL